jgi:hypothetical protein
MPQSRDRENDKMQALLLVARFYGRRFGRSCTIFSDFNEWLTLSRMATIGRYSLFGL